MSNRSKGRPGGNPFRSTVESIVQNAMAADALPIAVSEEWFQ